MSVIIFVFKPSPSVLLLINYQMTNYWVFLIIFSLLITAGFYDRVDVPFLGIIFEGI